MVEEINYAKFKELKELKDDKIILIDFYAVWCGPCRMQAPIIEDVAEEFKDNAKVKVCKVDVDEESELASMFGIMSIPTLVIMKNGEIAKTYIGLTDGEEIIDTIKAVL